MWKPVAQLTTEQVGLLPDTADEFGIFAVVHGSFPNAGISMHEEDLLPETALAYDPDATLFTVREARPFFGDKENTLDLASFTEHALFEYNESEAFSEELGESIPELSSHLKEREAFERL
jgi:hypothetical protein